MSVTMVSIVPDIRLLDSHSKGLIIAPDATQLNSTQSSNSANVQNSATGGKLYELRQLSWVESGRVGRYDQALTVCFHPIHNGDLLLPPTSCSNVTLGVYCIIDNSRPIDIIALVRNVFETFNKLKATKIRFMSGSVWVA